MMHEFSSSVAQSIQIVDTYKKEEENKKLQGWAYEGSLQCLSKQRNLDFPYWERYIVRLWAYLLQVAWLALYQLRVNITFVHVSNSMNSKHKWRNGGTYREINGDYGDVVCNGYGILWRNAYLEGYIVFRWLRFFYTH